MPLDLYAALALYRLAIVQPSVLYWGVISPFLPAIMLPVMVSLVLLAALAFYGIDRAIEQRAIRDGGDRDSNDGCGATRVLVLLGPVAGAPVVTLFCLVASPILLFMQDVTDIPAAALAIAGCVVALALLIWVAMRYARRQAPLTHRSLDTTVVSTILLALIVGVLLVTLGVGTTVRSSYKHLASATHAGYRYHLTREDIALEKPTLLRYRCDSLGVFCQKVDSYGYDVTVQSGLLDVDERSSTVTVHATDGQVLSTYPLVNFFLP